MNVSTMNVENVMLAISSHERFSDLTCVFAYENDIKPTPISKPIIAFSAKGCEIGPKLTNTLDTGEIVTTKNREIKTTISMDIYLPYSMGGIAGHKIFERLTTFLLFEQNYNILKAVCDEAEYDSSCQAIVLKSQIVFHETAST
mgnify:CR=1 FL=1